MTSEDYLKLIRLALESMNIYWHSRGEQILEFKMEIQDNELIPMDAGRRFYQVNVFVKNNRMTSGNEILLIKQRMEPHRSSAEISDIGKQEVLQRVLLSMMQGGLSRIYEDTVMMHRNGSFGHRNMPPPVINQYPLTISEI